VPPRMARLVAPEERGKALADVQGDRSQMLVQAPVRQSRVVI